MKAAEDRPESGIEKAVPSEAGVESPLLPSAVSRITSRQARLRRRVAVGLLVLIVVAVGLDVPLQLANTAAPTLGGASDYNSSTNYIFIVFALALAALAEVIVLRRDGNRIGWLLLGAVAVNVVSGTLGDYGTYAVEVRHRALPAGDVAIALSNFSWIFFVALVVLLPLQLFPDGRPLSRRWRWLVWTTAILVVVGYIANTFAPPLGTPPALTPRFPYVSTGALSSVLQFAPAALPALGACGLLGLLSLGLRYRRSESDVRHQIRWLFFAASLYVVPYAAYSVLRFGVGVDVGWLALVSVFGLMTIPLAMAIAVLRYRLYDIDVVISRTLVYGSLAALITGVYVGIAVGIGELVGSGGKPNLGLSILATAIVAVGFQPARERLQKLANRLVYGRRATPYQVLSEFSSQVAASYAADEVLPRMARALQEGTGAQTATVWLRSGAELRPAAMSPDAAGSAASVTAALRGEPPVLPGVTRSVEVRHHDELLGALSVTKRRGESLTPVEEKLLDDLAHQAGLVLKNVGLTADLQRRLEELRLSRQRLVSAQDAERRRLERNLHDGAQQHLVALKVKLGLAEMLTAKDPERAKQTIVQLKADADEALETLRDLARGIYPPLLAEKGLASALESQARKATLPVAIDADGLGRYPQELEATVYFCVLEALQNVQKYADASRVTVVLRDSDGELRFEVEDDGRGFDVDLVKKGAGLTNMEDRLDSAGGEVSVISAVGRGTIVAGRIPVPVANAGATPSHASGGDADRTETGAAARLESPPGTRRMPV